jgi:hypothetical protein
MGICKLLRVLPTDFRHYSVIYMHPGFNFVTRWR